MGKEAGGRGMGEKVWIGKRGGGARLAEDGGVAWKGEPAAADAQASAAAGWR